MLHPLIGRRSVGIQSGAARGWPHNTTVSKSFSRLDAEMLHLLIGRRSVGIQSGAARGWPHNRTVSKSEAALFPLSTSRERDIMRVRRSWWMVGSLFGPIRSLGSVPGQELHEVVGRGGVGPQRWSHDVGGGVAPAAVPVVRAVGGQRRRDRLAVHNPVLAALGRDHVGRAARHHVHHVQRTVHLSAVVFYQPIAEITSSFRRFESRLTGGARAAPFRIGPRA